MIDAEMEDFYLLHNGKIVSSTDVVTDGVVHVVPRLRGGKGGFGSMLRAIGAQIEKTTNREACRDLSGRRLRDINEEKRLKNWITQQAEREREAAERRKKRLERLCAEPRHEFRDQGYEQERSQLTEKVNDAVEQGFKASLQSGPSKRKADAPSTASKKKKSCLWLDAEIDLSSTESDDSLGSEEGSVSSCAKPLSCPSMDDVGAIQSSVKNISKKQSDCEELSSSNCESGSNYDEANPSGIVNTV
ncbi:splicing regulator SDE2 isoform X2 [Bacillus rossius redtenbacheri]|uniref:splicing regulator SDE2 isoform X2 n=1 Tax=Bacillus rossius redtenbacheri TaxID=93214 RepID=UPI002FDEF534